ncbi:MAG: cyclic pyranopterin monophosphate synthase MoaC [Gemmatimonadaceae bacterium]|nr:cyclic pyranopterin monophosphate synthase MoaC [Gemmatimonadaceae bacterium]
MNKLSHTDEQGRVKMVDVGAKSETARIAVAAGEIRMGRATLDAIRSGASEKGEVLATARIAAINAAKRTSELIPLCHNIPLSNVSVELELDDSLPGVRATATASATARTGVEMEALVCVTVALLTVYDMTKAMGKEMVISGVRLLKKSGGKSGDWQRATD